MSNFKILSANCRGLQDYKKRKDVFCFLRDKKSSIVCIQDTHFIEKEENFIRSQWGLDHISSYYRSDARGVSTLLCNTSEYKLIKSKSDSDGNYVAGSFLIENTYSITIINIYGPNREAVNFYESLKDIIDDFSDDFVIMCGDWNFVQNFDKDCFNYTHENNIRNREVVDNIKAEYNLVDPWRTYYPNDTKYTWQRRNPTKMARLDFFLISEELLSLTENVKIIPGYRSDHSIIELEFKLNNWSKGKGFWKFNNSLLSDINYVSKVKEVILNTKKEYSPLVVRQDKIPEIDDESIQLTIDDDIFF